MKNEKTTKEKLWLHFVMFCLVWVFYVQCCECGQRIGCDFSEKQKKKHAHMTNKKKISQQNSISLSITSDRSVYSKQKRLHTTFTQYYYVYHIVNIFLFFLASTKTKNTTAFHDNHFWAYSFTTAMVWCCNLCQDFV